MRSAVGFLEKKGVPEDEIVIRARAEHETGAGRLTWPIERRAEIEVEE